MALFVALRYGRARKRRTNRPGAETVTKRVNPRAPDTSVTLIICLKAADCVVFAADSISTIRLPHALGGGVLVRSCNTLKLHKVGANVVMGSTGLAAVNGTPWSGLLASFTCAATEEAALECVDEFREFVARELGALPELPISNRSGGNTFLFAGYEKSQAGLIVVQVLRDDIARHCQPFSVVSAGTTEKYCELIGDTSALTTIISDVKGQYRGGMSREDATEFARHAIAVAIQEAQKLGVSTIGGNAIQVAVVDQAGVETFSYASGVACQVTPLKMDT